MSTQDCEHCTPSPAQAGSDYDTGWTDAMRFAHHAHAKHTYNGHMSANGVLGAGPDAVIVDGDWLARIEERAGRPVVHLDEWMRKAMWRTRSLANLTGLRAICAVKGHRYGKWFSEMFSNVDADESDETPWCERCGREQNAR